jgi:hypothetical protein
MITTTIITLIMIVKPMLIAYFIITFEPFQNYIENSITEYFNKVAFDAGNYKHIGIDLFYTLITCFKCLTFWFTLLMTFNFYFAVLGYLGASLIKKHINLK